MPDANADRSRYLSHADHAEDSGGRQRTLLRHLPFETTLAGRSYVLLLHGVKKSAFRLHMFYLWIPSPELALLRIRDRVESGGHNVPERDVWRRFSRTLRNLFTLYRPLLDTLHFFDNSSDTPRLIFKDEADRTTINDAALYERLRKEFAP